MSHYNSSRARQAISNYKRAVNNFNQAVRDYNRQVDSHNRKVNQVISNYNSEVRAYNARVRANRQRLRQELAKLSSRPTRVTYSVTHRSSVQTLVRSFEHIEQSSDRGTWSGGDELFDLVERETANSVAVLNALEGDKADEDGALEETAITTELSEIDADLHERWRGALFALNPRNPDAVRQFCTSAREILVTILDLKAPDKTVRAAWPEVQLTPDKRVLRREKIRFCLAQAGHKDAQLATFVNDDINDVMELFKLFNPATHGAAGLYSIPQLGAIKARVEGAIHFLHRVVGGRVLTPAT